MGAAVPVNLTYMSEIVPARHRGKATSLCPMFACIGCVVSYAVGLAMPWRPAAFAGAVFPLVSMATFCLMHDDVKVDAPAVPADQIQLPSAEGPGLRLLEKLLSYDFVLRPFFLSTFLFLIQSFTGALGISFYTTTIFKEFLEDEPTLEIVGVILIGLTYVLGYVLSAAVFLQRFPRRTLLMASAVGMAFATAAVAGLDSLGGRTPAANVASVLALLLLVLAYALGFGPIPYIYVGELFPPEFNGVVTGLVNMLQQTFCFLSLKSFPYILEGLNMSGAFLFSSVVCVVGVIYVFFLVPETKDLSKEQIWQIFGRGTVKNASGKAATDSSVMV